MSDAVTVLFLDENGNLVPVSEGNPLPVTIS